MTDTTPPPASLRLRIDAAALAQNWRVLDRMSGSAQTGAAVKADGYGLGVDNVMPALLDAGARTFFVAHWSEVADVARFVPAGQIAVLHGVANLAEAAYAKATGAIPVINSVHQARIWAEAGGGNCHLMIDSGMNRLGLEPSLVGDPAVQQLQVDTLMSHLASADEDSEQNESQLAAFRDVVGSVEARQLSLANSAGIALGREYHFDLTRPGLALYGGVPRPEFDGRITTVAYIEAAVLQMRDLQAGDRVGYNARWTASEPTRVATVSQGYADGFLRSCGASGALHHNGTVLPILGRVSMDMVIVDSSDSDVREGDFLSFSCDLPQVSKASGLSQYELLTVLGNRFERSIKTG
ncbi:alanine racemase [Aurantiacibacter gangjinensis]|uniref:Alanine racemase n=1 Tax=Aurantiacibacter gangjinensis TaxID=502682 RepID=A0A0G9MQA4_9SPHN|nr:alanine racemase [Aurantiacibacter gangjinensis]APE28762.1 Alanine racemase [Aurantiacibacter gangjinensis]KLE32917.1 alanine racemase [Aurantiacibacter gangjinensis]